jgi:ABC-type transporter Mla MlaB component
MLFVIANSRCQMMRITVLDDKAEQRVVVEGKLTEPFVAELESAWEQARQDARGRPIVIDFTEVTRIDEKGEAALVAMVAEGARLTAKGVYWENVVKQLLNEARRVRARRRARTRAKDLSPANR